MSRPARIATGVALGVVLLVVVLVIAANMISDRLWFSALGYGNVYDKQLSTQATLFFGFGIAMGVFVAANIALGFALRPMLVGGPEVSGLNRYRALLAPVQRRSLVLVGVLIGLAAGTIAAGHWQTLLMWRYGGSFGISDPYFHHDAGFYVFELPWWHFVTEFAMTALVISLVAATIVHYLYGGLRVQPVDRHLTRAAGAHLAALGAAILLLKAIQTWLGRYDLVTNPGSTFSGMSYVGYHAVLPGQTLLAWLALVCAVLLAIAAWRTQWLLSSVALGLYAVAILGITVIWPAAMRSASVDGREVAAEAPFVPNNIAATRAAYGLQGVVTSRLSATPPAVKAVAKDPQINAVRTDSQQLSSSLGVLARAEVGYYSVAGRQTELLLAVRRIQGSDVLSAAFANPAGAAAAHAGSTWWTASQLTSNLGVRPQGLAIDPVATGYRVVPTHGAGTTGGYSLSSWWARAVTAIRYADPDLLGASGRLADLREPLQRVQQLAPWLTLDSQVYPAVVGGRVVWILDGYTTSATYPESQVESLAGLTADSANPRPTFGSSTGDTINYIRNSVKVVVDATTGAVRLYAWDEDPILRAMRSAFPGLIQPRTSIPPQLASVLRYPTTLFSVQRVMLANYRLTAPAAFLQGQGRWAVEPDPNDLGLNAVALRGLLTDTSGSLVPTLSSTYVDSTAALTEALLVVNTNALSSDYGRLELRLLPQSPTVFGSSVVAKKFADDPRVVALRKRLKTLRTSPMLTVPLGGGVLQAQTLYGANVQPGQLRAVVATFGGMVGYGPTLAAAIADIGRPHAVPVPAKLSAGAVTMVHQADALLAAADQALARGDRAQYETDVKKAKALLDKALR